MYCSLESLYQVLHMIIQTHFLRGLLPSFLQLFESHQLRRWREDTSQFWRLLKRLVQ